MTTDHKENLFVLVKSLSKSEKRQFKLYAGRVEANQNAKFLHLFNLLDKAKEYNEREILKKNFVTKQQLSNLKAHLYRQILVSLRMNPSIQNARMQIREQLDFATVLYQKGLYRQSLKILEKAKSVAYRYEEKYLAFEIVELEKVIESQYITRSMSNRAEQLIQDATHLSQQNELCSELTNLSLQLYERLIKAGYAKSDEEFRDITKFFFERLPNVHYEQMGFRERMWYCKAHVWYSLLTQDFLSSFKYATRWVDLFRQFPRMIESHPVFYLKANNFLLEALVLIKHPDRFKVVLNEMKNVIRSDQFPKNDNLKAMSFLYSYNNQLNLTFLEGEFKAGLVVVPEILEHIDLYKNQIDPHHIMLLYYKLGCLYFGCEDYENAILYLDKIVENKGLRMREDLLCFTRVLNLVAHYEAGFDYYIDTHIRDTYKFLLKMDDLHEVQKSMITFIRKLGDIYPHELKFHFKQLHEELKQYENDPYERRAFLYLDILSWLESKIHNKSIAEIIKAKAMKQLRQHKPSIAHL
ncbi:MAG: hypothetical protein ACPG8F_07730 [Flavobacteriaceae bacterium]